ncbi:hypothetical protein Misp01_40430 [Microtetraspora sp. NBRC 13810]|nr:hypothetical protein Misp01_40430 [Microtetraspora sp. NBRC 13810]
MQQSGVWKKSARGAAGGDAVEIALLEDGQVGLRDGHDRDGAVLVFTAAEWADFVGGVKDGEFDV